MEIGGLRIRPEVLDGLLEIQFRKERHFETSDKFYREMLTKHKRSLEFIECLEDDERKMFDEMYVFLEKMVEEGRFVKTEMKKAKIHLPAGTTFLFVDTKNKI